MIALAILHGGLSTLLAVAPLSLSEVYVFVAFIKIFVLVIFFSLYNGLVFLPILLSICGPSYRPIHPSYLPGEDGEQSNNQSANSRHHSAVGPTDEADAVNPEELRQLSPKKIAGMRVTTC